jgi:hypothetical protein
MFHRYMMKQAVLWKRLRFAVAENRSPGERLGDPSTSEK